MSVSIWKFLSEFRITGLVLSRVHSVRNYHVALYLHNTLVRNHEGFTYELSCYSLVKVFLFDSCRVYGSSHGSVFLHLDPYC